MDVLNFNNHFMMFISKASCVFLSCEHDKPGKKRVLFSTERKPHQPRTVCSMKYILKSERQMETFLGKQELRSFTSSSLICSECWFLFDSVWAGCIFLGICSFQCYPIGWYAVPSSIYGLVYVFALSCNASSFILILFIWVFSIFLVDSSKRFVDFIYL